MTDIAEDGPERRHRQGPEAGTVEGEQRSGLPSIRRPALGAAALLLLIGLAGASHAALGYALFLLATLLILAGVGLLAVFALTRAFETDGLRRAWHAAFWMGGWAYVLSVAALSGYYVHEALAGRIELRYMLFGPAVLGAIVALDLGIWRTVVQRNRPTLERFGDLWSRAALDQQALRRTLRDEVVLHRSLLDASPLRWVRHQLIFWGFGLMFLTDLAAVAFREAFPAFGWVDLWHDTGHPLRVAFDIAYEVTGVMVLVGCLIALGFRAAVNGTERQRYTDTPTTLFLLAVVVTGFMAEGARLNLGGAEQSAFWGSFAGRAFAPLSPATPAGEEALWIVHALAACAFIAYVPVKRLVHSCATPIGRLANSQRSILAAKKARVVAGLARGAGMHREQHGDRQER